MLDEALTWAARSGRIEAMAALLARGADIDGAPHNGAALHWALLSHRAEAVDWLIGQGADVSRGVAWGDTADVTPLHMAAGWANDPRAARLLLQHGADTDHPRPDLRQHPARLGRAFRPSGGRGGAAGQNESPAEAGPENG